MYKLFTKALLEKLEPYSHINEEQQGFRSNQSTTDKFNAQAYICFVDLKKVFDRVNLKDMIKI